MVRDDGAKAKKEKWSAWINRKLAARGWNAADLAAAADGELVYGTIYNWTKAISRAEAEAAVIAGALLGATVSEALEAASYPFLADVFEGKELHFAEGPGGALDPDIMRILSERDLPEKSRARLIEWWNDQIEEDRRRRIRSAEVMIAVQDQQSA